jgi:putative phage-type endonuclease
MLKQLFGLNLEKETASVNPGREKWLKERLDGIGASEAAAIIGKSPYMTNVELWKLKTHKTVAKDISSDPRVRYGIDAEEHLRALFGLAYPEYEVSYQDYDVVHNQEYPFIFATLDGRLIEKETGRKGLLEIKTAELKSKADWEKWDKRIPENYYIQVLHQLIATGFDFAVVHAQFRYINEGEVCFKTRNYRVERANVEEDMEFLKLREIEFWFQSVAGNKMPPELPSI